MSFLTPTTLAAAWSFRRELTYVCLAFFIILSLPAIAVVILMHTGINIVSDKLVSINIHSEAIQIKNPADGSIVTEINPLRVWPVQGVITLEFGESHWPYQPYHTGIDIANASGLIGDPVVAFMDGTVIYEGELFWGYGKHIIVDNEDNISSVYAHLDKIYVYKGQKVSVGDVIGREGSTGWSTGPHLHFEIRVYGIPVNPRTFLGNGIL